MAQTVDDLVVHHVEAHGGQRHARHDVDRAEPHSGVGVLPIRVQAGYHVAETDGRERHEAEVKAVHQLKMQTSSAIKVFHFSSYLEL